VDTPEFLLKWSRSVDLALDHRLPGPDLVPESIHQAMRYSVFAGGKRLRPALCLEAGQLTGAIESDVLPVACAIEMIHTYSLIHDDLPALDNDDLRRGQPTAHKKYGEAIAILAGDALLTRAFQILSTVSGSGIRATARIQVMQEIAESIGTLNGMIGGQVADLESEGKTVTAGLLNYIHRSKTGALIRASVRSGALLGQGAAHELLALTEYGANIGLAFQIVDDILDVVSSAEVLGKTPGKDRSTNKATYPAMFGLEQSRREARHLAEEAIKALSGFGKQADSFREMAAFIVERAA
jgi:geranylgeranyl diphosphate synthase type II